MDDDVKDFYLGYLLGLVRGLAYGKYSDSPQLLRLSKRLEEEAWPIERSEPVPEDSRG